MNRDPDPAALLRLAAGLACAGLLAMAASCAPRRGADRARAPGAGPPDGSARGDTVALALEQKLADFETALAALPARHWTDRDLEWDVREDRGRVSYVRQRLPASAGGTNVEYFYEDGRLFASRWRSQDVPRPGGPPIREMVSVVFFTPEGRLLHLRAVADGKPLGMDPRQREWWRTHALELGSAVLADARKHLAAR